MLFKRTKHTTLTPTQEVLIDLLALGAFTVAAMVPWLAVAALPFAHDIKRKPTKRQLQNSYDYLRRNGYVKAEVKRGHTRISLTKSGKKHAARIYFGMRPHNQARRWDGKWRVFLYDVPEPEKYKRELLRRFIRAQGFAQLQRSVWIYPYNCRESVNQLVSFLGLSSGECQLLEVVHFEDDSHFRRLFKLRH